MGCDTEVIKHGDVTGVYRQMPRKVAGHIHLSGMQEMYWFGPI
jgi:hypothetical protein